MEIAAYITICENDQHTQLLSYLVVTVIQLLLLWLLLLLLLQLLTLKFPLKYFSKDNRGSILI